MREPRLAPKPKFSCPARIAAVSKLKKLMPQRIKRRDLREKEVNLLVALRYGSLTNFDRIFSTIESISK